MNTAWLQSQRVGSSSQREDGNAAPGCHSAGCSELSALYVDTAEGCLSSVSPSHVKKNWLEDVRE